jgi:integrase
MFETKRDADAYMVKARGEVAAGTHVPDSQSVTVSEASDLWVQRGESDGLEATTVRQRRQHVDLHIKPLIGGTKLSRLTAPVIQEFVDRLLETRSRAMARRVLTSLKGILGEAQRRGLIGHNPASAAKITKRRVEQDEQADAAVIPPKNHLRAMIAKSAELWPLAHKNNRGQVVTYCWRPLIVTAIFTGMRASELRGLAWSNIDFESMLVRIRQRADRYNRLGPPKSKAGRREIPMAPIVASTLREWKLTCPKTAADLVFPSERGEILWHTNLYVQCFLALLKQCDLMVATTSGKKGAEPEFKSPYNFHALRHSAASLFIEQGWTPKKVQIVMGHSSIQVTFDIYGHLFPNPDDDAKAMAQIEARLLESP